MPPEKVFVLVIDCGESVVTYRIAVLSTLYNASTSVIMSFRRDIVPLDF